MSEDGSLESITRSGLRWKFGAKAVSQILQFSLSILLARLLSPHEFGLLAMVLVFIEFAEIWVDCGLQKAIIQKNTINEVHKSSAFWFNLASGLLGMGVIMICAPWIGNFYNEPELVRIVTVMAIILPVNGFEFVPAALMQRAMNFSFIVICELAAMVFAGIIAIWMALNGMGVWALVEYVAGINGFKALIYWTLGPWRPGLRFSLEALRSLFTVGWGRTGFNTVQYGVRNGDDLIVGKFIGTDALGNYNRAFSFMMKPLRQIAHTAGEVMIPALSRQQDDKESARKSYRSALSVLALVIFPMMGGLCVVADSFVRAFLGTQWIKTIPLIRIFTLAGIVVPILNTGDWLFISQGRTDLEFWWGLISGAFIIAGYCLGIIWGVHGVAWSISAITFILAPIELYLAARLINMSVLTVIRELYPAGLLTAGMMLGVFGVSMSMTDILVGIELALEVGTGVVIYGGLVYIFDLNGYTELQEILSAPDDKF